MFIIKRSRSYFKTSRKKIMGYRLSQWSLHTLSKSYFLRWGHKSLAMKQKFSTNRVEIITSIQRFPKAIFISVSSIEDKAVPRDFSRSDTMLSSIMGTPERAGSSSQLPSNSVASLKQRVTGFI